MEVVDATIVFIPRFTTLVANLSSGATFDFTTLPLDVSRYTGTQFQIWRGPMSAGTFKFFLEESLDCQKWVLGPSTPEGVDLNNDDTRFCSYNFRLRWFRIRIQLKDAGIVTCWAEGLLRGGGAGLWALPAPPPASSATMVGSVAGAVDLGTLSTTDGKAAIEGDLGWLDPEGSAREEGRPVKPIWLPKGTP